MGSRQGGKKEKVEGQWLKWEFRREEHRSANRIILIKLRLDLKAIESVLLYKGSFNTPIPIWILKSANFFLAEGHIYMYIFISSKVASIQLIFLRFIYL